jgi:polyisoprenoid-binding protein YceI
LLFPKVGQDIVDCSFREKTTMRSLSFALLLVVAGSIDTASGQDRFVVDPAHSTVLFRIKHLNTSYAYGRFNDVSGQFAIDKNAPAGGMLELTVKTASVDTANADRDKHLRSPDFFNVKQFPTATFKSTGIRPGQEPNTLNVAGDLTINGVTKPVNVAAELTGEGPSPFKDYRQGLEIRVRINRNDYGVQFLPQGLGEEVILIVSLEGIRK